MSRKKATDYICDVLDKIQKGNPNVKMMRDYLDSLSDSAFKKLVADIEAGTEILPYYEPPMGDSVRVKTLLKACDALNINVWQHVSMVEPGTGIRSKTPTKYMILDLPIRRQQQHVSHGKSVVKNSKTINPLTGQPTGHSKSGELTLPEIQMLTSIGLESTVKELIKVRGGDTTAFKKFTNDLLINGVARMDDIEALNSKPDVVGLIRAYLLAMMYENNF